MTSASQARGVVPHYGDAVRTEIEVKYRVPDIDALLAVLRQRGIALSEPMAQEDQAYAPVSWADGSPRIGVTFARLRMQDGRWLFTTRRRWTTCWHAWKTRPRLPTA